MSLGSSGAPPRRGAIVAFGNTQPRADVEVHGQRQRGEEGGEAFCANSGKGYVAPKKGQYTKAEGHGVTVVCGLAETLGGLSPAFCNLLKEAAEARSNRLTSGEYDATTWAARTWLSYTVQKVSVALHRAVALEIAESLGFATAVDARA